jgi:hypothetical protein
MKVSIQLLLIWYLKNRKQSLEVHNSCRETRLEATRKSNGSIASTLGAVTSQTVMDRIRRDAMPPGYYKFAMATGKLG